MDLLRAKQELALSNPTEYILPQAMGEGGKLQMEAASPRRLGLGGQGDLEGEISELDGLVGSMPGHLSHPAWCAGGELSCWEVTGLASQPINNLKWGVLGQTRTQEFWISALATGSTRAEKIFTAGEATQSPKPVLCV